jgi:hypothetical protein
MRAVKWHVVHPETVVTPWYKTRRAVMAGKVLWWLLTFLWGLAKAVVVVLAFMVGVVLMGIGILADFVGGPRR